MNQSLSDFFRDAKQALRAMRRAPLFALFAILTLGLGIGASTTVFTIVNTLLLNPLPARNPSQLVALNTTASKNDGQARVSLPTSYLNFQDWAMKNTSFSAVAGYTSPLVLTLTIGTEQERVFGELVTSQYFETLGIQPAKGRFFAR